MGRAELMSGAVWSAKGDWNIKLPARHREHVRRVVYDLIERDERKTPSHELDNRSKPGHGRTDAETRKSIFADRRIDDPFRSKAFEQTLTDFVSAVVFGDFFAHQKHVGIALQFFGERFVERLTISNFSHRVVAAVSAADSLGVAGDTPTTTEFT